MWETLQDRGMQKCFLEEKNKKHRPLQLPHCNGKTSTEWEDKLANDAVDRGASTLGDAIHVQSYKTSGRKIVAVLANGFSSKKPNRTSTVPELSNKYFQVQILTKPSAKWLLCYGMLLIM